jgi:hypothetical protein
MVTRPASVIIGVLAIDGKILTGWLNIREEESRVHKLYRNHRFQEGKIMKLS